MNGITIVFIIGVIAAIIGVYGIWKIDGHSNNNENDNYSMSGKVWVIAIITLFIVVNILSLKDCSKRSDYNHIEYRHTD